VCGYESYKFDNFMDLSLPIPMSQDKYRSLTLQDCLKAFIQEEQMEKCGYKCSKCKSEDNFKNQMTVWRYPKVLVIHLKRFLYSSTLKKKLNSKIDIPLNVDMRPYSPFVRGKFQQNS
jgi:ubiquitin C-terminal hydrolase